MTSEDIEDLREFARRIARLTPEQVEARKWSKWTELLRRREDPLAYEVQRDYDEDTDGVYR
jgi:hypothetical protein